MYGLAEDSHLMTPFNLICGLRLRINDLAEQKVQADTLGTLAGLLGGVFGTKK